MRWEERPEPEAGPGQAIVAVRAVGICGSDVHGYTGESGRRTPGTAMGHEFTGEVTAVGSGLSPDWLGKRVVVQPIVACATCDQCLGGYPHRCRNRRLLGGNISGAMTERVAVPAANLVPLSDTVSFEHGTLAEPLAVGIHAVHSMGDLSGSAVLIAGSGPIGLLTMVAARQAGARLVVMTDIVARRREVAKRLGADVVLDSRAQDWRQQLAGIAERGEVDVAVDAVGIAATFEQALLAVRPGGTVIALGGWQTVPVNLSRLVTREVHVVGSVTYTPGEFAEACRWLLERRFDPAAIVTHIRRLDEGREVFIELAAGRSDAIKTVLTM